MQRPGKGPSIFRNESEFVHWLQARAPRGDSRLRLGIGDDAALVEVRRGHELILTTDMSIEDVHFSSRLHSPRSVGHRAMARSLSDIAAMGGVPRYALVSLALSRHATRAWVKELYEGMVELARGFGVVIIGGDTAVVPSTTMIDVQVAGEVLRGQALRRSGAYPGELLYVSGRLGLAALGLRLLASQPRKRASGDASKVRTRLPLAESTCTSEAIQAHLYPRPQCALGRYLAARRLATAMIDLSDGLSTDLNHLCVASGVGARVRAERLPHPRLEDQRGSLQLALHGGEDYQLLFTVDPGRASHLPARFHGIPLHQIGEITRAKKVVLLQATGREEILRPHGYDHFRRD